jgi:hypothetical protein
LGDLPDKNGFALANMVGSAVDVSMFSTTKGTDVESLDVDWSEEPFYIRVAASALNQSMEYVCAFLDDDGWSTRGVSLITNGPSPGIWCKSNHLTMFAAFQFHQAPTETMLRCSTVNVLSWRSINKVRESIDWTHRPAAIVLLALLVLSIVFLLAAYHRDAQIRRDDYWKNEYFIVDLPPHQRQSRKAACCGSRQSRETSQTHGTSHPDETIGQGEVAVRPDHFGMGDHWSVGSGHLEEGMSQWTARHIHNMKQICLEQALVVTMQHLLAFQGELSANAVRWHVYSRAGLVNSIALAKSPRLVREVRLLQSMIPTLFAEYIKLNGSSTFFRRAWISFCVLQPFECLRWSSIHHTSVRRAKLHIDSLLGALCVSTVLFSVDGGAPNADNPDACQLPSGTLWRFLILSLVAGMLNSIAKMGLSMGAARQFIHDEGRRSKSLRMRYKCTWFFYDACFWSLALCISAFHILFICVFLANLRPEDEAKWNFIVMFHVTRILLLNPVLIVGGLSSWTSVSIYLNPSFIASPPTHLGIEACTCTISERDDAEGKKVRELAGRGIALEHILNLYELLIDPDGIMPTFEPTKSTTRDVVFHAIIPLSYDDASLTVKTPYGESELSSWDLGSLNLALGYGEKPTMNQSLTTPLSVNLGRVTLTLPRDGMMGREKTTSSTSSFLFESKEDGFKVGSEVEAIDDSDGYWYPGTIKRVKVDGTYLIKWGGDYEGYPDELKTVDKIRSKESSYKSDYKSGESSTKSDYRSEKECSLFKSENESSLLGIRKLGERSETWGSKQIGRERSMRGGISSVTSSALGSRNTSYNSTYSSTASSNFFHRSAGSKWSLLPMNQAEYGASFHDLDEDSIVSTEPDQDIFNNDWGDEIDLTVNDPARGSEGTVYRDQRSVAQPIQHDKGPLMGRAYASVVNNDQYVFPTTIVTHNWNNSFTHLVAAVISHALGLRCYNGVANTLNSFRIKELRAELEEAGRLHETYWICAFSVNQHSTICQKETTDSLGNHIDVCPCHTEQIREGKECEVNKFDLLMQYLKHSSKSAEEGPLQQLVAIDRKFEILSRIWCVAELFEAYQSHIPQQLCVHSDASRSDCMEILQRFDVRKGRASHARDKEYLLSKIADPESFNRQVQQFVVRRVVHPMFGLRLSETLWSCAEQVILSNFFES